MMIGETHNGTVLNSPDVVADIMTEVLSDEDEIDRDKEHFWIIGLDIRLNIRYIELCALGHWIL